MKETVTTMKKWYDDYELYDNKFKKMSDVERLNKIREDLKTTKGHYREISMYGVVGKSAKYVASIRNLIKAQEKLEREYTKKVYGY